jgi:hypothetical protein
MSTLDGKILSGLLEKVYLGGMIGECLLVIKDGQASISALDYTHTIRVHVESPIEAEDLKIGLPSLSTLNKVLAKHEKVEYKIKDQNLILLLPDGEKITLLTLDVDNVPTSPEKEFDLAGALKDSPSFECPPAVAEKLSEYRGLLSTKTVNFWTRGKAVNMGSMSTRERKFTIPRIAELDQEPTEDMNSEYMAEHVEAVLKVAKKPTIYLIGDGMPLVITSGNDWWTIQALVE